MDVGDAVTATVREAEIMWGRRSALACASTSSQRPTQVSLLTTHVYECKAHDSLMMPSWAQATNASNRIPGGLVGLGVSELAQVIT